MRLTAKRREALAEEIRAWLDENGPAVMADIATGLGWHYDTVTKVIRSKPDWLVAPGYVSKRYAKIVLYASSGPHALGVCERCHQRNFHHGAMYRKVCVKCSMGEREPKPQEIGYTEDQLASVNPWDPCPGAPGSDEKVLYLASRYENGVPNLWDDRDAGFEAANGDLPADLQEYDVDDEDWD